MKDIKTYNAGTGQIKIDEPAIIMRPVELHLKVDGAKDNTPSLAFVFALGTVRVTPSVVGEISVKMLNEALGELGYKIEKI